jgi:nicotinic acid phosphoribosyltransferase
MTCRASTPRLLTNAAAATLFHVGAIHRAGRNNRAATELSLRSNCTAAHAWFAAFEEQTMRYLLLWILGVPIPVLILIWLMWGH